MGVVNFSEYLNSLIEAGSVVEGNVVRVISDNGRNIGDAVFKVIQGGNGVSSEVGINVQEAGGAATATGMAFLSIEVNTVAAALLPAFGVVAGIGIYELVSGDTDFHSRLVNALYEEGKTVGGRVIAFWNGNNIFLDEETIEIYKNVFLEAQAFGNYESPDYSDSGAVQITSSVAPMDLIAHGLSQNPRSIRITPALTAIQDFIERYYTDPKQICFLALASSNNAYQGWSPFTLWISEEPIDSITLPEAIWCHELQTEGGGAPGEGIILSGQTAEARRLVSSFEGDDVRNTNSNFSSINTDGEVSENLQPGARIPTMSPFQTTYPYWLPWEFPQTLPDPSELPTIYPIKYPGTEPDPYPEQEPAQNPDPEPAPAIYPEIMPDFPLPEPSVPVPEPEPAPDPDPEPGDIEPLPDPDVVDPTPDPVNPNPGPTPSPIVPVPALPATVSSNKLFTVYNPTPSQLDQLGGYLWDSSIIAAIRDIWQEPMDGLISLQQVYVTPVTSGSHNIILGFLDSGVSSAVVSQQFVTVDCGSVTVPENKENATDYAPYTSLHLFLPFIGIVELDTNECMNSSISVKYQVDVYTGTCLAQVAVNRTIDMPNSPILYTYSGNCSQQIPLTSGNSTGMLNALIGGITAGLSVASGGGLGVVAGATIAGHSLTHEMFHVSHSGNLSANAGIMGQKKPYLIIGRRHCYDANSYNTIYGYPANKTVTLGNHSGYVKVKDCHIKTVATQPEYERIVELLKDGIFL